MQPVTDPDLLAILNGGAPASGGPVYGPPPEAPEAPTPFQVEDQNIQRENARRAQLEWDAKHNPDGSLKPEAAAAADGDTAGKIAAMDSVVQQINHVQGLYNRGLRDESFSNLFGLTDQFNTPSNAAFDSAGAALGDQGMAAFKVPGQGPQSDQDAARFVAANQPASGDWDERIEEKLDSLRRRINANRQALGLPPVEWVGVDAPAQDDPAVAAAPAAPPPPPGSDMERPWTPADPGVGPATGGTRTVEGDPAVAAEYRERLASGQSASEIIPWLRSQGASPQTLMQAVQQLQYRKANPNVPIESYSITSTREVPLSAFEQGATELGNTAPGAYAIGAGQFLSGNTLDNLTADPERARTAMAVTEAQQPGATLAGNISGGILAALSGEAGLARLGMASGIGRATLADVAMGAGNGAGAADDGSRLAGAAQGGFAAGLGSLAGAGAMNVAGRVASPSGGRLAELYESGVRPTPGQRFADSGIVGRAVNATEEALQSVPIVGTAIAGARQEARDQFQVGAFNQALAEIGEELPRGMKPGTDPHAFAQEAFNRVYERARSGMRLVADEELSNNLGQLAPDIATLGPQAQNKLRAIMQNTVNNRIQGGALEAGAYKTAVSDLGKHIGRLRKSAMGEDQALADVLEGVRTAIDNGARRHSDPAAVELLDAADAGYARLVRIEQAAARRGGDDGTFTPTGFDGAVQQASGGVRSKAYLRGDALMQDYANQGKALSDRMPNSGTTDRALAATTIAGGAAYVEPTTLGVLGAIAAAYAPGVRQAMTGAMAPGGPTRKAIAQQLKRRARLAGRVGAAGAAASLPGTAPAP